MTTIPKLLRSLRCYFQWRFRLPHPRVTVPLLRFGSAYGGYHLDDSSLGSQAVVYSLGIGDDISFDLALIDRFGLSIHAFDPTPRVKTWLASQKLPEEFHFHDVGIADFDGDASFFLPPRPDYTSHSLVRARQYSRESISVPMSRLANAMSQLGHTQVDVLKMDIEGAEYGVIQNLVQDQIPVGQILVEFHHRLSSIGIEKTRHAIALLREHGMEIAHVCPRAEVFTFLKVQEHAA